jgi:hypothetical protein
VHVQSLPPDTILQHTTLATSLAGNAVDLLTITAAPDKGRPVAQRQGVVLSGAYMHIMGEQFLLAGVHAGPGGGSTNLDALPHMEFELVLFWRTGPCPGAAPVTGTKEGGVLLCCACRVVSCSAAARVHPGETNSSWLMKGAVEQLLADTKEAAQLRETFVFKVSTCTNPQLADSAKQQHDAQWWQQHSIPAYGFCLQFYRQLTLA